LTIVGLVVFSILFIACVLPLFRIINLQWPESCQPAAPKTRKIETSNVKQSDQNADCVTRIKWKIYGKPPEDEVSKLNKRNLSPLEQLMLASGTGAVGSHAVTGTPKPDTPDSDRVTLSNFFANTQEGTPCWINSATGSGRTGWLDDNMPIGRWQGCTVDAPGRCIKLSLISNNITGTLEHIRPLSGVMYLSLKDNNFTGPLDALAGLSKLVELDLSHNKFFGHLDPLAGCIDLVDLDCGHNELEGTLHVLGGLRKLERLILRYNRFHGELDGLGSLKELKSIDVSMNKQLAGELPPDLHFLWASGKLPLDASGTGVGKTPASRPGSPGGGGGFDEDEDGAGRSGGGRSRVSVRPMTAPPPSLRPMSRGPRGEPIYTKPSVARVMTVEQVEEIDEKRAAAAARRAKRREAQERHAQMLLDSMHGHITQTQTIHLGSTRKISPMPAGGLGQEAARPATAGPAFSGEVMGPTAEGAAESSPRALAWQAGN